MSKRIELGEESWMSIRTDLSVADIETITHASRRWDAEAEQWDDDPLSAAIAAVPLLVEEWAVPGSGPPTAATLRTLPAVLGLQIIQALSVELLSLGLNPENFPAASASSPP